MADADDGLGFTPDATDDGLGFTPDQSQPADFSQKGTLSQATNMVTSTVAPYAAAYNVAQKYAVGGLDAAIHAGRAIAGNLAGDVNQASSMTANDAWGTAPDSPERKAAQAVHDATSDAWAGHPYTVEGQQIVTATNKVIGGALKLATDPETYKKIDQWSRRTFGDHFTDATEAALKTGAQMVPGDPYDATATIKQGQREFATAHPVATANLKLGQQAAIDVQNALPVVPAIRGVLGGGGATEAAGGEGALLSASEAAEKTAGGAAPAEPEAPAEATEPPIQDTQAGPPIQTPKPAGLEPASAPADAAPSPTPAGPTAPAAPTGAKPQVAPMGAKPHFAPTSAQLAAGDMGEPQAPASPADAFTQDLTARTPEHPDDQTVRRVNGNASVQVTPNEGDPGRVGIKIQPDSPRGGYAGQAMQKLTALADQHGVALDLDEIPTQHPSGQTVDPAKLQDFYTAHGFEPAPGGGYAREPMSADVNAPPLEGMPQQLKVNGLLTNFGPTPAARTAASKYMAGKEYDPPRTFEPITPSRGAMIADAYDKMQETPNDPTTKAAYAALSRETIGQLKSIQGTGLKIQFIKDGQVDQYAGNPRLAALDVRHNNHLWVRPTGEDMAADHPLAQPTGMSIDGRQINANDAFRIVHDYYGHVKEGNGFRADGEFNAYRIHKAMYSPLAQKALATETLGQNAFVNFGPNGAANRVAKAGETAYAPQKVGLLSDEVIKSADMPATAWAAEMAKKNPPPAGLQSNRPAAQARTRFPLPKSEGIVTNPAPLATQADRVETVKNTLGPEGLTEMLTSAKTADYHETSRDFTLAKASGKAANRAREVINQQQTAMRNAVLHMGSSDAAGDASPAASGSRGAVMADMGDTADARFNNIKNSMYKHALEEGTGLSVTPQSFLKALDDDTAESSGDVNAQQLHAGVVKQAQKMGIIDDKGAPLGPVTADKIERLRQFIGKNVKAGPSTGTGKALKGALDDDVATAYAKAKGDPRILLGARYNAAVQNELFNRKKIMQQFMPPDSEIEANRELPIEKFMDTMYSPRVTPTQFRTVLDTFRQARDHFRTLGDMQTYSELARKFDATKTALRDEFVARATKAGEMQGGAWDQAKFAQFLQENEGKMQHIFDPQEMAKWERINKSGNILKLDKTYKGAAAETDNLQVMRDRLAQVVEGGVTGGASAVLGGPHAAPVIGAGIEMTGIGGKIRKMIAGDQEERALKAFNAERVTPLQDFDATGGAEVPVPGGGMTALKNAAVKAKGEAPLGAIKPKQQGAVGDLTSQRKAMTPATVNIGLKVGENGSISSGDALDSLKRNGVNVKNWAVQESNTEPTLVAQLNRPLKPDEAERVASELKQESIAQHVPGGNSDLYGPQAESWRPFNPDYFLTPGGVPLSKLGTVAPREGMKLGQLQGFSSQRGGPKASAAQEILRSGPRELKQNLTPEETRQATYRQDVANNLIDAFKGTPPAKEYAAAALAGSAKRGWYKDSANAIEHIFGADAPRFAGLLAAMSPQTSVEMNFHNALRTFINWDDAGRPQDPSAIRKIMEQSSLGADRLEAGKSASKTNVLDAWVNNSVDALTHPDPEKMTLSGPKVHSFYQNLRNNVNEVTNDSWMAKFAKVLPEQLGGSRTSLGPGKSATYMGLSAKTRQAAVLLSKMTGEKWTPAEVQETVWSWAKTAWEHADTFGGMATIPELVKNGEITDDLIRSTQDFYQLFGSPEHRGIVESSRYAGNARGLAGAKSQSANAADASETRAAAQEALRSAILSAAKRLEGQRVAKNATRATARASREERVSP